MKLKIKLVTILVIILCLFSSLSLFAEDIIYESAVILENSDKLNGKAILYQGEAIGDIMYRDEGNYGWINVNDGENAIGIWAKKEDLVKISILGTYQQKGDILLISGVLNSACEQHGGDLDVHAQSVEIVEKGVIYPVEVNEKLFNIFKLLIIPTVILLIVALVVNIKKDTKKE